MGRSHLHGRFEHATAGTPCPLVQRQTTAEIRLSTRFTLLLLVSSCVFEALPIARCRHVMRCAVTRAKGIRRSVASSWDKRKKDSLTHITLQINNTAVRYSRTYLQEYGTLFKIKSQVRSRTYFGAERAKCVAWRYTVR